MTEADFESVVTRITVITTLAESPARGSVGGVLVANEEHLKCVASIY